MILNKDILGVILIFISGIVFGFYMGWDFCKDKLNKTRRKKWK